jgi:hypothetical protein
MKQKKRIIGFILSYFVRSIGKDQLFSTKPRIARSGSKPKLDKFQLPPTDSSDEKPHRLINSYVEIIGRGYADEKHPTRRLSNENTDDKQVQTVNKPRAKIIKGNQKFSENLFKIFFF